MVTDSATVTIDFGGLLLVR